MTVVRGISEVTFAGFCGSSVDGLSYSTLRLKIFNEWCSHFFNLLKDFWHFSIVFLELSEVNQNVFEIGFLCKLEYGNVTF